MTGKVLGIGGFGITYLGYDLTLDIRVAIKEYMPSAMATRHADRYQVTLTGKSDADYRYGMQRFSGRGQDSGKAPEYAELLSTCRIISKRTIRPIL